MSTGTNTIGIALGGGMAHGLAHIGVLRVLEENGIVPEIVAGTSIGAVIGALYAGGISPDEIEKVAVGIDWVRAALLSDVSFSRGGFIRGNRLTALLKSILGNTTFGNLKRRFACVATDIANGEAVVFENGSLLEAVRASLSIPGIFTPVEIGGRYLVDGGLVNEIPVGLCREMGASFAIGVNVIPNPAMELTSPEKIGEKTGKARPRAPSIIDVLVQSIGITGYHLALEDLKESDLAISPDVASIGFWQIERAAEAISAGEKATREALEAGAWKVMLSKG